MSDFSRSVQVFHFTSRISNAKIRKYKEATERGMAPGTNLEDDTLPDGRSPSLQPNGSQASPSPSTPDTESQSADQPPAKKPRLKLNVRQPKAKEDLGDTIAVTRPRRSPNVRFRYSQDMAVSETKNTRKRKASPKPEPEPEPAEVASPASSALSSLVSAPPSEREESPFKDPSPAPEGDDYGLNFMNYYIEAKEDDDEKQKGGRPKAKAKSRVNAKQKSKPEQQSTKAPAQNAPVPTPAQPAARNEPLPTQKQQPQQQPPAPPPAPPPPQPGGPRQGPPLPPQHGPPPPPQHQHPQQPHRPQHIPPPYPMGAPPQRGPPHLPPPPPPMPQPVIQFIDIKPDPKPQKPDTVAEMVRKLDDLSMALSNFGGITAMPPSPPPEKPEKRASKTPQPSNNPLDSFLSLFGAGDDGDSDDEKDLDRPLPNPGAPDGPLSFGVQFIQNALKSWAQQRLTHSVTEQYQAQHRQQMHQHHMQQAQRRGPGRPRRYDEPDHHPVGPPAVIHTDLAATPEGVAIKAFQTVLDSGCLQVNGIFPVELARSLRHLYMQIDHLINQGAKTENNNWQCMSYGAQISAHKARVDKWKEDQAKAQAEMAKHQQMMESQKMAVMGFAPQPQPGQPFHPEQAQQQHAIDLERKRSMQHAVQQPYNSQQHLNPMQLGGRPNGTPMGAAPSPASNGGTPNPPPANGPHKGYDTTKGTSIGPDQVSQDRNGTGPVSFDKVKVYTPGLNLPRSGQSMKFSFAAQNEESVRAFGTEAFPVNEPGPRLPNRGPMSAPPPGSDAQTPIDLDADMPANKAFRPSTGGFTAVNAPGPSSGQARPNSMPTGESSNGQ